MMTLNQMMTLNPNLQTEMFQGSQIDAATQAELIEWFQFREVPDDARFVTYFGRLLRSKDVQYNQYLQVQMTVFDPMVSEYLERQILRNGTNNSTTEESGGDQKRLTQSGTREGTNSSKTTYNNTTINHSETDGSDSRQSDGTSHNEGSSEAQHLDGDTPDSATYPQAQGFPVLNWTYTSGQQAQTGKQKGDGTSHSEESGTTKAVTDGTVDGSGGSSIDGTSGETSSGESSEEGSHNRQATVKGDNSEDVRERQTGRHEAPQDMLDRARRYILRTNAFQWLVSELQPAFCGVYD